MADCSSLFNGLHKKLLLDDSKKKSLITGRNAIRKRIKKYFKEKLDLPQPLFWSQGSFTQDTIVNPTKGNEYDLDDGVYIQGFEGSPSNWPDAKDVRQWIIDAVDEHTDEDVDNKEYCIRVAYAGDYHIDLPIYGNYDQQYHIAKKSNKWEPNDPKNLTSWIRKKFQANDSQLIRCVRYLKGWKNNQGSKMPSGLFITLLVIEQWEKKDKDDIGFARCVANICDRIDQDINVFNPIKPDENLTLRLTKEKKDAFKRCLPRLRKSASNALKEQSEKRACQIWSREFGDYFPSCDKCSDDKNEEAKEKAKVTAAPAILNNDARSA